MSERVIADALAQIEDQQYEIERLREALTALCSWQPHTEAGLAALHPQHREAVERGRSML